jgi:SAM-dependent methyltransferase
MTDRAALAAHRRRAERLGMASFLHDLAADEIEERLAEVNRRFTEIAVVTGHPPVWRERFPDARIVPDDDLLDLTPGAHDLVIHALSLHWANDPVGQLVQSRRALRPDGLLLCVSFGGQTLAELRTALAEAEVALTGGLSPRVLPMGEIRDLGGLLQRAGLALPVADSVVQTVTYADPKSLLRDLRAMGETNAMTDRARRTPRQLFDEAARVYASGFPANDDRIRATFELVFLTGWAPDESQQKPLRPGSAKARLADALNALERPAGDAVRPHRD